MLTGSHFYQRKGAKSTLLLSIINVGAGKISADDATALTGRKRAVFYVIKKHTLSHLVTCAGGKMLVKNVAF
jgi:hypothetical protein